MVSYDCAFSQSDDDDDDDNDDDDDDYYYKYGRKRPLLRPKM